MVQLEALIERLRNTTGFNSTFQLALTALILGRVLVQSGGSTQAIPILRQAVSHWEGLVEEVSGHPWEELLATPDRAKAAAELANLSIAMGDLGNALSDTGQHTEALAVTETGLRICARMGNLREIAASLGCCAGFLRAAGRYDESDARYDLALTAARQANDIALEGSLLQGQGILASERQESERASRLYQQALRRFHETGAEGSMMRTYNALGVAELNAGRLAEARTWYEKSRELAIKLQDQPGLGQAAQNIGIAWQLEGKAARERSDEPAAQRHFSEASRSLWGGLRVWQALGDKPHEASSWGQLARLHFCLGDLAVAERHAHKARQIHESLGLKEAQMNYSTLSEIAHARGDITAAAEWAKKRDDLLAEVERRAG